MYLHNVVYTTKKQANFLLAFVLDKGLVTWELSGHTCVLCSC